MKYRIQIAEKIEKQFKRIPKKEKTRIIEKIDLLAENPRPETCKKLQGSKKSPLYRIWAGNYRIIYAIQDNTIEIKK